MGSCLFRAVAGAALIVSSSFTAALAADKAFKRQELADHAMRLEAQIRGEAGTVTKPAATLRREAETAFERQDARSGLQLLGQAVTAAPQEAGHWLRLARAILQVRATDERERATLLDRAATAAYVAYQRTTVNTEEADALVVIGRSYSDRKVWRPALDALRLALELRESADVRQVYEQLRDQHGFRLLDYSVDSDATSPRVCFQFSEELPGRRVDFSTFVAVAGQDKPALSTEDRQLCVEGLKHGERYAITLRAGLPSSVKESLAKSADFSVYVRDRSPFVRFTSRAYVLPRSGQRGIPVVTVNTSAVNVAIFRIGDRSLIETVLGNDFQRNIERHEAERLGAERGMRVWAGELKVEPQLNVDVTTAFPIDQAVGDLQPGVYVMTAEPAGPRGENYEPIATQWFVVSDIGLTAYSGNDGVTAFTHSLASTAAKSGIEVRLVARNNEILATRTTDAAGVVRFEAGLVRGEGGLSPALLIAADPKASDYAFLSLKTAAFDLSDRGVSGRPAPAGLDAFVFTERGVYRSGETVHVTALLRDAQAKASTGAPLTLVVERPDGVEYRRAQIADQGLGGRSLSLPLVGSAMTGSWRVKAYTDPKGAPVGEARFLVEDYVPDRLEFDLATPVVRMSKSEPALVTLEGRFLYGAPASNLELEGEIKISASPERPGFAGYQFGNADEEVEAEQQPLEDLGETDAAGKAQFTAALDKLPTSSRPLQADIVVRMSEPGGRAVERTLSLPIAPDAPMIGVKPLFSGKSLGDGETATFDVVVVAPDGKAQSRAGLRYDLLKVESRYQWYRQDGRWEYERVKLTRRVADGRLDVTAANPGRIAVPVSFGRYRLEVSTDDSILTTVTFEAGWFAEASADTPDLLEIGLDKPHYQSGDAMTVTVTARTAGKVTLSVIGDRLLATTTTDVQAGTAKLPITVGRDWGTGAYVIATLRRPLDQPAGRMPGRAIGVQWFSVDRPSRSLTVDMRAPDVIRSASPLRVPIKVSGLAAGEDARIVVAAVDVGILNLTNYKPPAPDDYYLGQRRLSADIRDLYGQLIDGMQGTRGQIRTGGDGAPAALAAPPPTQPPVALYSGLVTVKPDGTAEIAFDVPAFAGTLRVMAVAWSRDKVGRASADVIVRDAVVLTATLPRFLLTGDRTFMRLDLDNVEGAAGDYRLALRTQGPLAVDAAPQVVRLAAKQRTGMNIPIRTNGVGAGAVIVRISGPNDFAIERTYALTTKPATQILTRRVVQPIGKGESLTVSQDLLADFVPGSGHVALSVGLSSALDVAATLKALDRYPFGCTEQITSRALPLLYMSDVGTESQLALEGGADQRIRDAVTQILARQGSNGSFGLWSTGGDDHWLDAYVTEFLTRARERNIAVPDTAFRLALDRLRNFVAAAPEVNKDGGRELAYSLYVLARNGVAPLGDLRYLADARMNDIATPIAKAQVAAALGLLGDRARAERAYTAALASLPPQPGINESRSDYGSSLRDATALATLAAEGNAGRTVVQTAVQRIEAARSVTAHTSTQENAWLVLAARALARDAANLSLDVGGEARRGAVHRTFRSGDFARGSIRIANTGEVPAQAVLSVSGAPLVPEPPAANGFTIERQFYTLEGDVADPAKATQNQRFAVVLKITEAQPQFGRVMVADYLPAGFEIDNPRLVSSGDAGALAWIEGAAEPVHTEFRDDRFTAAFDREARDSPVFTVAYVVRAVSPGRYVLPQAHVEDMYRPERFGRTATGAIEIERAR